MKERGWIQKPPVTQPSLWQCGSNTTVLRSGMKDVIQAQSIRRSRSVPQTALQTAPPSAHPRASTCLASLLPGIFLKISSHSSVSIQKTSTNQSIISLTHERMERGVCQARPVWHTLVVFFTSLLTLFLELLFHSFKSLDFFILERKGRPHLGFRWIQPCFASWMGRQWRQEGIGSLADWKAKGRMTKKGTWKQSGSACRDGTALDELSSTVAGSLVRHADWLTVERCWPSLAGINFREAQERLSMLIMGCVGALV